ncbi:MAG: L,D-transpeptidase [Verrucomicrobiota bacterium]
MDSAWELLNQTCDGLGIKPADRTLLVRIGTQTLQFYRKGRLERSYVISTSRRPPSNVKDSLGTPRGLHVIAERIGGGQPIGMVFKGRVSTGMHFGEFDVDAAAPGNLITSRILWLRGLEPGVNAGVNTDGDAVDTFDRYIYVHGTNHEDKLGTPQSAGCVLMGNLDIIALYDEVRVGDQVLITD